MLRRGIAVSARLQQRALAVAAPRVVVPALARAASSKQSPFAPPPPSASGDKRGLTRKEELKARQDEMAKMLMDQAMREVSQSASAVRPEGIQHLLNEKPDDPVWKLAQIRDANAEIEGEDEQGGPKGGVFGHTPLSLPC